MLNSINCIHQASRIIHQTLLLCRAKNAQVWKSNELENQSALLNVCKFLKYAFEERNNHIHHLRFLQKNIFLLVTFIHLLKKKVAIIILLYWIEPMKKMFIKVNVNHHIPDIASSEAMEKHTVLLKQSIDLTSFLSCRKNLMRVKWIKSVCARHVFTLAITNVVDWRENIKLFIHVFAWNTRAYNVGIPNWYSVDLSFFFTRNNEWMYIEGLAWNGCN